MQLIKWDTKAHLIAAIDQIHQYYIAILVYFDFVFSEKMYFSIELGKKYIEWTQWKIQWMVAVRNLNVIHCAIF